ncbi:MAG: medium chain dehydrogenase/reductase family protein [Acidimicrobiaceae bacterium]|nr:medium chain dehydrogenase/reductase family protein [Acidimicrobiaceae bacterium]
MEALLFSRKPTRYAAAAVASKLQKGAGITWAPLHFDENTEPPSLPKQDGWQRLYPRLSGICGSDLATIDGRSSLYFEDFVSFPFTPGHEIVADTSDGRRVVVESVLGHAARGYEMPHPDAAPGDGHDYRHLVGGHLKPGLQTGSCASTGGGWATELVAHESQLHEVPAEITDEQAVMVEPLACGVHAALKSNVGPEDTVVVIGAGTMGLTTVAALRHVVEPEPKHIFVGCRYPTQQAFSTKLGADMAVNSTELKRAVRRTSGSFMIGRYLSGGADVVIDTVGSESSLAEAMTICRPRGRIVLLGMPSTVTMTLTGLWHREIELVGCYAYGTETLPNNTHTTSFEIAIPLAKKLQLDHLVTALYPLHRYKDAIRHAAEAGQRGAVKIVFDMRAN